MDALAGYGSSSDDDDDNDDDSNSPTLTNGTHPQNAGLSSLVDYSDAESDKSISNDHETNGSTKEDDPIVKKRRISPNDKKKSAADSPHNNNKHNDKKTSKPSSYLGLPPPRLSSSPSKSTSKSNAYLALVEFDVDYTQQSLIVPTSNESTVHDDGSISQNKSKKLEEKLDRFYQSFYSSSSSSATTTTKGGGGSGGFGAHLRSQKDFGNPDIFPSIISHFGIDPVGSNLSCDTLWNPHGFKRFEYVEKLASAEEAARIRQADEQHEKQQQQDS